MFLLCLRIHFQGKTLINTIIKLMLLSYLISFFQKLRWIFRPALWSSGLSHCLPCQQPLGTLAWVLAAFLPIQLPNNVYGEGVKVGATTWATDNHVGDLNGVLEFWFSLSHFSYWEVDEQMEDWSPFLSPSFSTILLFK